MLLKNVAVVASLAGSLFLGACSSDSNPTADTATAQPGGENPTTLQATTNIAVQPTAPVVTTPVVTAPEVTVPVVTDPVVTTPEVAPPVVTEPEVTPPVVDPNARIAAQLADGVLDAIVLDDGTAPITSGSWPRFTPNTSWTWQLLGDTKTTYDVDVYVLDMFQQLEGNVIETLHAQNKQVICYFSAGTFEPWRPDADLFANVPMGGEHYAYATEIWVDVTSPETAKVMANRMDMAVALGCDGVELDNVDGFVADTGLNITYDQELAYQRLLANEAHKRNLAVALKNAVEMIPDVAEYFDMAINEVCLVWNECGTYQAIIDAGKPVFHVEYDQAYVDDPAARAAMCAQSAELNMRTLVMPKALDGSFRISCDD